MPYHFSEALDDALFFERVESFKGGMDSFNRATLLSPDASQDLVNCIIEDNHDVKTRAGADALGGAAIDGAKVQALCYFDTPQLERLLAVSDTALYQWDNNTWQAVAGWTAGAPELQVSIAQGLSKVYLADGSQNIYSWDGTNFTNLLTGAGNPPPLASILCWHSHRLIASGIESEPDALYASNLLDASSGQWNHAYFKTRVGGGEGDPIVGLVSLQNHYLGVLKKGSLWLVNTDPLLPSSAEWPFQLVTNGIGCVGKRAFCQYGNDVFFLSRDGIRSVRRMAGSGADYEVSPPLSQGVQTYIDRINWEQAYKTTATKYRHLILFALPLDAATEPSHVLVWNGRLEQWVGCWTGWTPTCFAITRFNDLDRLVFGDTSGRVNKWKNNDSRDIEDTFTDNDEDIATSIRLRAMLFGEPVSYKDLEYLEIRFAETNTTVTVDVYLDETLDRTFTIDASQAVNQLPVNLPFDLAVLKPSTVRKSLIGLSEFNEMFIDISTASGRMGLKNVTVAAFLNTIQNE